MNRSIPGGISIVSRFGKNRVGATAHIYPTSSAIIARARCDAAFGLSVMPPEQTLMVVTHLKPLNNSALWVDGHIKHAGPSPASTVKLIHLDGGAAANLNGPLETLEFYLPRATLNDIAERHGVEPFGKLSMREDPSSRLSLLAAVGFQWRADWTIGFDVRRPGRIRRDAGYPLRQSVG